MCLWHPRGGCGFARHGTYPRVSPPGTLIPRWRCPKARRTLSALPDWLAARRTGTLAELEATVLSVEKSGSLGVAVRTLRTDIELPGALRYLGGLTRAVQAALGVVRGLEPERFAGHEPTIIGFAAALDLVPDSGDCVLEHLRSIAADHLTQLPAPLGFNPRRIGGTRTRLRFQHDAGADPPRDVVESR